MAAVITIWQAILATLTVAQAILGSLAMDHPLPIVQVSRVQPVAPDLVDSLNSESWALEQPNHRPQAITLPHLQPRTGKTHLLMDSHKVDLEDINTSYRSDRTYQIRSR